MPSQRCSGRGGGPEQLAVVKAPSRCDQAIERGLHHRGAHPIHLPIGLLLLAVAGVTPDPQGTDGRLQRQG